MTVAIASALVHFLWQGAVIGAGAWLSVRLARTPRSRYLVGVAALLLMAAMPVATTFVLARNEPAAPTVTGAIASPSAPTPVQTGTPGAQNVQAPPSIQREGDATAASPGRLMRDWTARVASLSQGTFAIEVSPRTALWLTFTWLAGVAVLAVRLAAGWSSARRLARAGVRTQAAVRASADRLMAALGIGRAVAIIESTLVDVPAVVGWIKPIVLLPAAAMSGLSSEQVEALLAHELAHVRRHDYVINLVQSAIETVLFYHPAVWLVSRRVRHERELCCDDLALAVCGDRVAYASALAELETLRTMPALTLAANGGSLVSRVRRILGHEPEASVASPSRPVAGVAVLAALLLVGGTRAAHLAARSDDAQVAIGGVSGGISGGQQGGIRGGTSAADPAGVRRGVAGGVPGGIAGGIKDADTGRPIAAGDRLMVAVGGTDTSVTVESDGTIQWKSYRVKAAALTPAALAAQLARLMFDARFVVGLGGSNLPSPAPLVWFADDERPAAPAATYHAPSVAAARAREAVDGEPSGESEYHIKPGDELAVDVQGLAQVASRTYVVDAGGAVFLPSLSRISVAGLTPTAARDAIQTKVTEVQAGPADAVRVTVVPRQAVPPAEVHIDPVEQQPAPDSPLVAAGQTIRLEVRVGQVRQAEFNRDYTVQTDGNILVPYIGVVMAAGKTPTAVQSAVQQMLTSSGTLPGATVMATIETNVVRTVSVIGAVRSPGVFAWREGLTVADAVDMAGGPVKGVDISTAEILPAGAAKAATDALPAGAIVKLPPQETGRVTVRGAVRMPGQFMLTKTQLRLPDAINAAGGLLPTTGRRVIVTHAAGATAEYAATDLLEGRLSDTALVDGDTITVDAAPQCYVNGFVAAPGQYAWSAGMTLGKALKLAGGVTPDGAAGRVKIERKLANGSFEAVKLAKDPMDTPIQPDDVITVPKRRM